MVEISYLFENSLGHRCEHSHNAFVGNTIGRHEERNGERGGLHRELTLPGRPASYSYAYIVNPSSVQRFLRDSEVTNGNTIRID